MWEIIYIFLNTNIPEEKLVEIWKIIWNALINWNSTVNYKKAKYLIETVSTYHSQKNKNRQKNLGVSF